MSQIFLAFGSSDQFFMKHAKGWDSSTQQQSSQQEMTQKLKAEGVDTYCFAFGEGSWFAAFTEASGKSAWKSDLYKHYPKLYAWLKGLKSFDAKQLTVSLGPEGAYWARSKGSGQTANGLPQDLLKKLELHKKTKSYLTLGLHGSFIYWNDEGYSWYSIKGYPGAFDWLDSRLKEGVQIVAASLSAFQEGVYFILLSNGDATWVVPEDLVVKLRDLVERYKKKPAGSRPTPKLVAGRDWGPSVVSRLTRKTQHS